MSRVVTVVGIAFALAACSASSSQADNTADAAPSDASVEAAADAAALTDCVIPAGVEPGPSYGAYLYDALPSGSCNTTIACRIAIDPCCVPTADGDAIDEYTCTCVSGAWQCVDTVQGGGPCQSAIAPNCSEDSLDSGTD